MTGGLPHNWETERAVLGAVLLSPDCLPEIEHILRPEDFARPQHGRLWRLLTVLARKGTPPDVTTVLDAASEDNGGESLGGLSYIAGLTAAPITLDHVAHHARRVRDHAARRAIIAAAQAILERAPEEPDPAALVAYADEQIDAARQGMIADAEADWTLIQNCMEEAERRARKRYDSGGEGRVWSGIRDLDDRLTMERGDLVVLAARPAMGKSLLAYDIAEYTAWNTGAVGFRSLEMSTVQIGQRAITRLTSISVGRLRSGEHMGEGDFASIAAARQGINALPLYVNAKAAESIQALRAGARALKRMRPDLALVVVDYLQLMDGRGDEGNREQEVAKISRGLKVLAKELDVVVLALSQLNRGLEARANKRPMPSDLRESGAIEQDADSILFLYRDEVYDPKGTTKPGIAEIIIAKQRQGELGTVEVRHAYARMRMQDPGAVDRYGREAERGRGPGW